MSTTELKLNLHQLIDSVTDNAVLQAVYTLLSKTRTADNDVDDWYEGLSEEAKIDFPLSQSLFLILRNSRNHKLIKSIANTV